MNIWLSLKAAAAKVSVSVDIINRRALEWQDSSSLAGRIAYRLISIEF